MASYFDPFTELNRLTGSVLQDRSAPRAIPVDLYREPERYVLNADMPGIDPGSIDIDIDGQLLTLRAHRTSNTAEGVKWLSRERPGGSYLRQFSVGEGVDTERISASYDNGVLSVILPLSERAKPRKVAVESTPRSADASLVA
ncbi:Hsp20/alpha crystallin family protein [Leucobacter rhizosphaerae]|uniref:Hsp20/alpha crystallin family protein n=1 Tax=Leucobacter rhizosphaerae TaxID=2932245 RepID=A0ABY4FTL5_9MICO|nr:Hsp20/alpha crystallin family protein [Leucobacter rhizosphaerae]UOQ59638.1 Hsp20/alpha crystallin family protein [Leucobacter rhizosphaerae]